MTQEQIAVKACDVNIFGQNYTLRVDLDDADVRRLAELVDSRMREVASASPSASTLQIAVLAALDIASEKVAGEGASPGLFKEVGERADTMLRLIESADSETLLV